MNCFPLRWKGGNHHDRSMAQRLHVINKGMTGETEHPDELEGSEEIPQKRGIIPTRSVKAGEFSPINRYDGIRVVPILDKLKNPRISHKRHVGVRESPTQTFQSGESTNEITESALMDNENSLDRLRQSEALVFSFQHAGARGFRQLIHIFCGKPRGQLCLRNG